MDPQRPLVRRFVEDPLIRIMGFLLLVAAAVLLYLNPEYHLSPRWRGGPIPSEWQPRTVAERVTLPLPPGLLESHPNDNVWKYESEAFTLMVFANDRAFPVQRDAENMNHFRATSVRIGDEPARMGTWEDFHFDQPYHLAVSLQDTPMTLLISVSDEDTLSPSKSAIHAIQWSAQSTPGED
jgi:hypothetical protein